jgi:hypothetical protein
MSESRRRGGRVRWPSQSCIEERYDRLFVLYREKSSVDEPNELTGAAEMGVQSKTRRGTTDPIGWTRQIPRRGRHISPCLPTLLTVFLLDIHRNQCPSVTLMRESILSSLKETLVQATTFSISTRRKLVSWPNPFSKDKGA